METLFHFRTAEFTDQCQVTIDEQPGLTLSDGVWQNGNSSIVFTDYFLDGLQMTTWKGQLARPFKVELEVARPWLAMYFQLDGQVSSRSCASRPLRIGQGQQNLMSDEAPWNYYTFQGPQYSCFTVHLTPAFFAKLVLGNPEWLAVHEARLGRQEPFVLLPEGAMISPFQRAVIQQIFDCPYTGSLQKLFLEARFLDLFMAQQAHLLRSMSRFNARDRDILYAVRDFLEQEYAAPPSLIALARRFGTNDYKLKKGFRQLFGTTVFGYVAEKRLAVAQQLLTLTGQSVQKVAEAVGFSNPANFATAYRRKFGQTPSQVRLPRLLQLA
jgi:AraC family transcriptional activator of pyochelin receptor